MMNPDSPLGTVENDLAACRAALKRAQAMDPRTKRYDDLALVHPKCRDRFEALADNLVRAKLPFRVFETYRSPIRQNFLRSQEPAVTKAFAWESAHQYGLAVDFVGFIDGMWSWDAGLPWGSLARLAQQYNLVAPVTWDKGHVEAQDLWADIKSW